ncbi:sodium-dependent transporter [Aneurinibacillus aneurinilyticus]|uniref:sodium-dependent transporter n=1 Tax=Aneurinibacillus aneurinilyticus TaxID=1391 RepID=UPI003524B54B
MSEQTQWTSRLGFILAAAGSAIGLGAIWKFPYMTGTGGGGAFFVLFLLFTVLVGMPLLLAEFLIGRSTQKEAVSAYKALVPGSAWPWIGRLGVLTCFLVLSFYSVVGGWILLYLFRGITGQLWSGSVAYDRLFGEIIASPYQAVGAQLLFLLCTIYVVARGVQQGIERANKYMMPALFLLFIALIVRSLTLEGAWAGVTFFLQPDFSKLTSEVVLYAMGQSFFSLTVGASVMVTYSSYLSRKESLIRSATSIVSLTVFISFLAGLAIFPAVFSLGMEPAEGPGLLFIVLPSVFAQIPFGHLFFIVFLVLFLFATLTSAFSMLEIIVAAWTANRPDRRKHAAIWGGMLVFLAGVPSALSFGLLSDVTWLGKTAFDLADYAVSNVLLPLGALLIAIFAPWKIPKDTLLHELSVGTKYGRYWFAAWFFFIRYVAPLAIIVVFLDVTGIL